MASMENMGGSVQGSPKRVDSPQPVIGRQKVEGGRGGSVIGQTEQRQATVVAPHVLRLPTQRPAEVVARVEAPATALEPKAKRITTVSQDHNQENVGELGEFGAVVAEAVGRVRVVDPKGRVGVVLEESSGDPRFSARFRELVRDPENPLLPSDAYMQAFLEENMGGDPFTREQIQEIAPVRERLAGELSGHYTFDRIQVLDAIVEAASGSLDIVMEAHDEETAAATQSQKDGLHVLPFVISKGTNMTTAECDMARKVIDQVVRGTGKRDHANAKFTVGLAALPDVHELVTLDGSMHARDIPLRMGGYTVVDHPTTSAEVPSPIGDLISRRRANPTIPLSDDDIRLTGATVSMRPIVGKGTIDLNRRLMHWIARQKEERV